MFRTGFFKSSEFAGVGSAVKVGFDYRGLSSITEVFLKVLDLTLLALPLKLDLIIGAWLVSRTVF